jgi:hypothetical protein
MFRNGANQEFLATLVFLNRGSQVRVLLGAPDKTLKKPNKYEDILKIFSGMVHGLRTSISLQNYTSSVSLDRFLNIWQFLEICIFFETIHAYHLRNKSKTWRGIQVALVRQINRKGAR